MSFLRRLFGRGERAGDDRGLYYYVRCDVSGEVIQVRLDKFNDLSIKEYKPMRYFARKLVVGARSFNRMEAEFTFDGDRRLIKKTVSGGEFVEYEDYLVYQAEQEAAAQTEAAEGDASPPDR